MKKTTKIKLILKKYTPSFLFSTIFILYKKVFSKIPNLLSKSKVDEFKKEQIVHLSYFGKNYDLLINPKNKGIDHELFLNSSYEPHIMKEIINNIKSGDTAIDIGANIGHHAIFTSLCVGKDGKVFSFEPIPSLNKQIQESAKINNLDNINIFQYALGDTEGEEKINISNDNVSASSILKNENITNPQELIISVKTLDSFNIINPKLIKIDVEGYEYNVLKGAKNTIKTYHPIIIMEYSPLFYRKYDKSHTKKIIEFLRENNYQIYDIEDGNKKIINDSDFIDSFDEHMRSQTNILCK